MYSLLWKKYTDNIKANIKYSTKYQNIEDDQNGITIINYMEQFTLKYKDQRYQHESYTSTQRRLYNFPQGEFANVYNYEKITNNVKAIKSYGYDIGNNPPILILDEE